MLLLLRSYPSSGLIPTGKEEKTYCIEAVMLGLLEVVAEGFGLSVREICLLLHRMLVSYLLVFQCGYLWE